MAEEAPLVYSKQRSVSFPLCYRLFTFHFHIDYKTQECVLQKISYLGLFKPEVGNSHRMTQKFLHPGNNFRQIRKVPQNYFEFHETNWSTAYWRSTVCLLRYMLKSTPSPCCLVLGYLYLFLHLTENYLKEEMVSSILYPQSLALCLVHERSSSTKWLGGRTHVSHSPLPPNFNTCEMLHQESVLGTNRMIPSMVQVL